MDTYLAGHTAGLSISEPYLLTLCPALALLKSLRSDQLVRHILVISLFESASWTWGPIVAIWAVTDLSC